MQGIRTTLEVMRLYSRPWRYGISSWPAAPLENHRSICRGPAEFSPLGWDPGTSVWTPLCTTNPSMSHPDSFPPPAELSSLAASPQPRLTTCDPAPPPHIKDAVVVACGVGVPVKQASPSPPLFGVPRQYSPRLSVVANQRAQLIRLGAHSSSSAFCCRR